MSSPKEGTEATNSTSRATKQNRNIVKAIVEEKRMLGEILERRAS